MKIEYRREQERQKNNWWNQVVDSIIMSHPLRRLLVLGPPSDWIAHKYSSHAALEAAPTKEKP